MKKNWTKYLHVSVINQNASVKNVVQDCFINFLALDQRGKQGH